MQLSSTSWLPGLGSVCTERYHQSYALINFSWLGFLSHFTIGSTNYWAPCPGHRPLSHMEALFLSFGHLLVSVLEQWLYLGLQTEVFLKMLVSPSLLFRP